jgi:hypothetical protein
MSDVESWFERRYISAVDLDDGGDAIVTIKSVRLETIENRDGSEEKKPVVTLAAPLQADGPVEWVLNKTNVRTIKSVLGTGNPEAWAGKRVALYKAQVSVGSDTKDAIRVRPRAPQVSVAELTDSEIPF